MIIETNKITLDKGSIEKTSNNRVENTMKSNEEKIEKANESENKENNC